MQLPPDYTPARLTAEDLTFDELDLFVTLVGKEIGAANQREQMRGLAAVALVRAGVEVTGIADLGALKLGEVLDMEYLAEQGAKKADPTVAGA